MKLFSYFLLKKVLLFEIIRSLIFSLLKSHLNEEPLSTIPSRIDHQVFNSILDLIHNLDEEQSFFYEYSTDLDDDNLNRDIDYEPIYESHQEGETYIPYDYCVKVLEYKSMYPRRSFDTLRHQFRLVKDSKYLTRFQNYVEKLGTSREKYVDIAKHTYEEFIRQRSIGNIVHDRNLRLWAIRKAREFELPTFKASKGWIQQFKLKYGIRNRKINSITTHKRMVDQQETIDQSIEFVLKFNEEIAPHFQPSQIINIDQSGFRYVHLTNRTLSFLGEKDTEVVVPNSNATTHSYTIMPMLSIDGRLRSPLYINLQETTGSQFGPIVEGRLADFKNVFVSCTRSGKMDTSKIQYWSQMCLNEVINDRGKYFKNELEFKIKNLIYFVHFKSLLIGRFLDWPFRCRSL